MIKQKPARLVIDLSRVTYIDSSGLAVLIEGMQNVEAYGGRFFLAEMELVVPWEALLALIEPHYPVAGRGRRPYPLDSMLRVHLRPRPTELHRCRPRTGPVPVPAPLVH